jgi:hypothetical protein
VLAVDNRYAQLFWLRSVDQHPHHLRYSLQNARDVRASETASEWPGRGSRVSVRLLLRSA